jgi:hypothetical protein
MQKSFISENDTQSLNSNKKTQRNNDNYSTVISNQNDTSLNRKTIGFVDINSIDSDKDLNSTSSPLEFFIISLSRSLNLKPRQSVALLANNRKFLIQISNRGIKGDYSKVIAWYQELFFNYHTLLNLVNFSSTKDAKSMTFATLTVGLFSKNTELAQNAFQILLQLDNDMGMDYEWLFKDGLDILYFTISKHEKIKQEILDFLEKMYKEIPDKLSLELFNVRKLGTLKIYDFLGNIMDNIMDCGLNFLEIFRTKIPDFCFNEKNEIAIAIAILGDYWIKIIKGKSKKKSNNKTELEKQRETSIINNILKFFKNVTREKNASNKNILYVVVTQFFRLMKKLAEFKDEYAPQIYKILVFMFLENYNENKIREVFLTSFNYLFELDNKMPIEILLEPYLRQLKGTNNKSNIDVMNVTNYDLSDFKFLFRIISHPKLSLKNLKDIMEFCTLVTYTNLFYSRTGNLLIITILEKNLGQYNDLLYSKNLNQEIIDIYDVCISYIKNTLKIFLQNPKDYMILETPYNIACLNINYIKSAIENEIIDSVEAFRKNKGVFSQAMLSLLWIYEKHDDVLLNLEEKYTERYIRHIYANNSIVTEAIEKRKLEFMTSGKPEKFLKFLKDKREKNKKNKDDIEFQNNKSELETISFFMKKKILEENNLDKISEILKSMKISYNNLNLDIVNKIKDIIKTSISAKRSMKSSIMIDEGNKPPILLPESILKNLPVFYDYENEAEIREKQAIEGLCKQYGKEIKKFFGFYVIDTNNLLNRNNLIKMLRDLGFDNQMLNMDEFISIMKSTLISLPKNIDKNQFENILMQISYFIFTKINTQYTISMTYMEILKILSNWCKKNKFNSIKDKEREINTNKNPKNSMDIPNNKIYEYLKSKIEYISLNKKPEENIKSIASMSEFDSQNDFNLKNKNEYIMIPPGYTKKFMTQVKFEYSLPNNILKDIIPESKLICYEILSDILLKDFSSSLIEPYVKIFEEMKLLDESAENKKNWGNSLTIAFTKLEKKYEKDAIETTDTLEEILRAVSLGRENVNKPKYQTNIEKSLEEEKMRKLKEKEESERIRDIRKKELDKRLTELKNEKKFEEAKKEEDKKKEDLEKDEKMKSLAKAIEQKRIQMKQDVEKKKKEQDKIKEEKENAEKIKKVKKEKILENLKKDFFKKQKRKLKEQFKEIREIKKDNFLKNQQDLITPKLPERNIQKIIEKDRDFMEFEKKLNENIEELLNRNDMKEFLTPYEEHFRLIYDFYANLGSKKFTFFYERAIHLNEFREFCSNFMIFGLLLSYDQINFIFKRISRRNEGTSDDLFFLRYNDFLISIIYISICLKNSRRKEDRITQSDLNKVNISSIRNLIEYMGLKLPFNKKELDNFINDRRTMSAKQLHLYTNQTKKKTVKIVKNPETSLFQKNAFKDILAKEAEEEERLLELEELRQREIEEINQREIEENEWKNKQKEEEEKKRYEESINNTKESGTNDKENEKDTNSKDDKNKKAKNDKAKGKNDKDKDKEKDQKKSPPKKEKTEGKNDGDKNSSTNTSNKKPPNADKNPNFASKKSNIVSSSTGTEKGTSTEKSEIGTGKDKK